MPAAPTQRLDVKALSDADLLTLLHADMVSRPSNYYQPHAGQRRFHAAKQRVRALFPGNRFGKTIAAGIEAARTLRTPKAEVVWVAPEYRQFEQVRVEVLERKCFDSGYTWNASEYVYRWPNGARMFTFSNESDWKKVQGTHPDLIVVDEECDVGLYRELLARGAGRKDTRYIVSATATSGATWMESMIYQPWMEFHRARGLSEQEAAQQQLHPDLWVWPFGGLSDNPHITESGRKHFASIQWRSDGEKRVREHGGFARISESPVFDMAALDDLRKGVYAGERGGLKLRPIVS